MTSARYLKAALGINLKRRSATLIHKHFTTVHKPYIPMPYSDSGESISKGEISTVVVAARACGNVKNLSLLTGYTGGQQASCGHEYPRLTLDVYL